MVSATEIPGPNTGLRRVDRDDSVHSESDAVTALRREMKFVFTSRRR